jgi:ATP-dependent Zn protease
MITNKEILNLLKYKNTFDNLDYTRFNQLINKKEISQIIIDNKKNDIFSSDLFHPTNFHITHVEPYISQTLINKIIDKSIPLYFIDHETFNILLQLLLQLLLLFLIYLKFNFFIKGKN